MSVDWFLFSPSHKRSAMIGSIGLFRTQSFPCNPDVVEFVRWAIEEHVTDVVMIDEPTLHIAMDDE